MPNIIDGTQATITTEEANMDGTGDSYVVAGPYAEEVYIDRVIWEHAGTNIATSARLWWNNGADKEYAKNNRKIDDKLMPANTLDQAAASEGLTMHPDLLLPTGHRLLVTFGTAVASGFDLTVIGGDYQYA